MAEAADFSAYLLTSFMKVLSHVQPHLSAEAIYALAVEAVARSVQYAQDHPYATAGTVLNFGLATVLGTGWLTKPLLQLVGLGPLGPIAGLDYPVPELHIKTDPALGTAAAWYQSTWLGAYIPAGSAFAWLQQYAMTL